MISFERPEDELLISVARRSLDSAQTERVRLLLRSDLDWTYLMAMAHRHSVVPLLYYHLNGIAPQAVPSQSLSHLRRRNDENTRQSLLLTGELLKLMNLLQRQGIPAVPFKGPTLALRAYGDVGLRQFGDLDILVHKPDVLRVKSLLIHEGFQPTPELTRAQEAALLRFDCAYNLGNDQGVLLDVHWNFAAPYASLTIDVERLWQRLEPLTVSGHQVPGLAVEDLLLALCLHGATHFWERLGWIADISGLLDRHQDIDWERIFSEAAARGNKRMLSLGLYLAGDLLGANLPAEVWETVRSDAVVEALAGQVQQQLFAPETMTPGILAGTLAQLRTRERTRDKLWSGLRLAATPRTYDWMSITLPAGLHWLYYPLRPLRLVGKYAVTLLRLKPEKSPPEANQKD